MEKNTLKTFLKYLDLMIYFCNKRFNLRISYEQHLEVKTRRIIFLSKTSRQEIRVMA